MTNDNKMADQAEHDGVDPCHDCKFFVFVLDVSTEILLFGGFGVISTLTALGIAVYYAMQETEKEAR